MMRLAGTLGLHRPRHPICSIYPPGEPPERKSPRRQPRARLSNEAEKQPFDSESKGRAQ